MESIVFSLFAGVWFGFFSVVEGNTALATCLLEGVKYLFSLLGSVVGYSLSKCLLPAMSSLLHVN